MRRGTLIAGILGAALMGSYLANRHGPSPPDLELGEPGDSVGAHAPGVIDEIVAADDDAGPGMQYAAGQVRAMSPSFRHSSLLVAIRAGGYYCDDVVSATESAEGVWVASCADKGGYTLSVRDVDRFEVRPIAHYFDGVEPRVRIIER